MVNLASLIDHTILKPDATVAEVERYCGEAGQYGFAAVCVNPLFVGTVRRALQGSQVATCSVVAFPFGATPTAVKVAETHQAVADGATEIDMVIMLAAVKSREQQRVRDDIAAVRQACGAAVLKVIIETCFLTEQEKVAACLDARAAGAAFVKTSTGFGPGGATIADVSLMRTTVGAGMGVKASGGIRTGSVASAMVAAGATRIGSSNGVALIADQSRNRA